MFNSARHARNAFVKKRLCLAIAALSCAPTAFAAPVGGVVSSGAATIGQTSTTTTIDQTSQRVAINWQGFSIGAGEKVNFNQPNASAIALNRVVGNEKSVIEGSLNANGKVFLLNSNGVLFAKGSSVNTAGLVASTLGLGDDDFVAGNFAFTRDGGSGAVVNRGAITVADGGYVALLGKNVTNEGVIVATRGAVALAGGDRISLNFNGDSLLNVSIDRGALDALVSNQGAIVADGGKVFLTAKAADELLGSQVNNSGIVRARTLGDLKGEILADAAGGTMHVGGSFDASAPVSGDGGTIETSGSKVKIADSAVITTRAANGRTGTWTVDPDGFTIGANGDITSATLGLLLADNNITLASTAGSGADGNVNVNDAVSWSGNTRLTLTATNDININAPVTATGSSAGLALNYGGDYRIDTTKGASVTLSGANASLSINGTAYTLVHSMSELAALDDSATDPDFGGPVATGYFALAQNLDASGTTYAGPVLGILSGALAGLGHTINHLTIVGPNTVDMYNLNIAPIGMTTPGTVVRDIGIVDVNVTGYQMVAGLVGWNFHGEISNAFTTGVVSGNQNVGGLVGLNDSGSIANAYSTAAITGTTLYGDDGTYYTQIGGLVGANGWGSITDSYATGNVTILSSDLSHSVSNVGGLVGNNGQGSIVRSHATGNVTTSEQATAVGGLAGVNGGDKAVITDSYATGKVTSGQGKVGGLVGNNFGKASIARSYATGEVVVSAAGGNGINASAGGLVGWNGPGSTITDSHSTGNVSGSSSSLGGLVGMNAGVVSGSTASGNVTSTNTTWGDNVGGLVGYQGTNASITGSQASGNVASAANNAMVGGLVGVNGGSIDSSGATGNVSGTGIDSIAGGLAGWNVTGSIRGSSATGSVTLADGNAGRLVGKNEGIDGGTGAAQVGTVINSGYHDVAAEAAAAAAAAQAAAEAAAEAAAKAAAEAAARVALQARGDSASHAGSVTAADAQRAAPQARTDDGASVASRPAPIETSIRITDPRAFSANVQRIEVDGKVFELEDDKAPPAAATGR